MPKTGRPIIGELKDINIKVRIGQETDKKLKRFCQQSGYSKAKAIREALEMFLKYN
jgi:predicted DNA-binding protein